MAYTLRYLALLPRDLALASVEGTSVAGLRRAQADKAARAFAGVTQAVRELPEPDPEVPTWDPPKIGGAGDFTNLGFRVLRRVSPQNIQGAGSALKTERFPTTPQRLLY